MTDLLVVVNASAGTAYQRDIDAALAVLTAAADQHGDAVDLVRTKDLAELDTALHNIDGRRLVLLGGDGSVHAAVQCLHRKGRLREAGPIGLIPLGTGNDLAGSLGIPADPAAAAKVVMSGACRSMELLVSDEGDVAVNAVHVGIGAAAARKGASVKDKLRRLRLGKIGKLGYLLGAVAAGFSERGWRLSVRIDGKLIHDGAQPILMAAMGLGGTVGGGARLIPGADPHDGDIDVVLWESVGAVARLAYALSMKSGDHVLRRDVRTGRGQSVEIRAVDDGTFLASNDGEIHGPFTRRRWDIECGAWQVIVPTNPAG